VRQKSLFFQTAEVFCITPAETPSPAAPCSLPSLSYPETQVLFPGRTLPSFRPRFPGFLVLFHPRPVSSRRTHTFLPMPVFETPPIPPVYSLSKEEGFSSHPNRDHDSKATPDPVIPHHLQRGAFIFLPSSHRERGSLAFHQPRFICLFFPLKPSQITRRSSGPRKLFLLRTDSNPHQAYYVYIEPSYMNFRPPLPFLPPSPRDSLCHLIIPQAGIFPG